MARRLLLPFFLGCGVLLIQMPAIQRPFLGHFASYQLVMASMARNMARENFSEIHLPKTDLLVNGKRSLHLNQYPFPSVLAALGLKAFGGSLEFWGRFQAILMNAGSAVLLALIAGLLGGDKQAKAALSIYAFSPFSLVYGQGFFSEPLSLFFFLLGFYLFFKKTEPGKGMLAFSGFCFSIAVTGRIHWVLFLPLPFFWIAWQQKTGKITGLALFSAAALALPALWYVYTYWVSIHSDHVLTNLFLQAGARGLADRHFLLSPDYYRRIFDILTGTMLTPLLLPFLIFGLLNARDPRPRFFLFGGAVAGGLLFLLCPQKIMAHDFYLYPLFPFLCLAAAGGFTAFLGAFPTLDKPGFKIFFLLLYLAVSSRYFTHPIFHHEEDAAALRAAAQAVREHTRPDESIIVVGKEPAPLAYYADRPVLTMDLNIGQSVPYYLSNPRFSRVDLQEVRRLETAMKDLLTWFEYLRAKGASYAVVMDKRELEKTRLLDTLEARDEKLSSAKDPFLLFRLRA